MAFQRPTLQEIIDRVEGDLKTVLGLSTILRRSFLAAIARAIAGVAHILHGHMVFVSKQIFPDQAEAELLDRWGSIYGLERQPATFAQFTIDIIFTGPANVAATTAYQRTDGVTYTLDSDVDATLEPSFPVTLQGTITADDAGDTPNMNDGSVVSLQSPIANVQTNAVVAATVLEGGDTEEDDSYRQRIIDRIQAPPAGGTISDYIAFMKTVTGVTRGWVLPSWMGQGTVGCTFVLDNDDPIIPIQAKVDEVQVAVNERKPVTAEAFVFAPTDNPINMTIAIKPNTAAVRAAVLVELQDLIAREAQVKGAVADAGSGELYTGIIPLSRINEAISIADGEDDHNINFPIVDAEPEFDGGILTLGTITFLTLA